MTMLVERLRRAGPKRLLSLDGGGIRGVVTLGYLERIEQLLGEKHGDPNFRLADYFDLIGGTSTGSIIASGLAIGLRAAEIKDRYFALGGKIFGQKKGFLNYLTKGYKYDSKPLEYALRDFFGDIALGDQERIRTGLCIFTKRAETFSTWALFNHPDGMFYSQNRDWPLWQIIMASAAAPTYFIPVFLEDNAGDRGAFIDGGISMVNNPSFRLFLLACLQSYPFHWVPGKDNLLLVSVGTGKSDQRTSNEVLKKKSLLGWAAAMPEYFMYDANQMNQMIMQLLSESPTARVIDSELGNLEKEKYLNFEALSYLRYDIQFSAKELGALGIELSKAKLEALGAMDNPDNMEILASIGAKAAESAVLADHFSDTFHVNQSTHKITLFETGKSYSLPFQFYVKREIPIEACEIGHPFYVMTMEGLMHAKAGDYLVRGIHGEYYACDREIFYKTYSAVERPGGGGSSAS